MTVWMALRHYVIKILTSCFSENLKLSTRTKNMTRWCNATLYHEGIQSKLLTCLFLAVNILVGACADGSSSFPVTANDQTNPPEHISIVRLDYENVLQFNLPPEISVNTTLPNISPLDYKVGPGDEIAVAVYDQSQLSMPRRPNVDAEDSAFVVQTDGTFFYPFLGKVQAAGKTVSDIRQELTTGLADFLTNPQVEVRVLEFTSQTINTTGEVMAPRRQTLTGVPLRLMDAINASGGFSDFANPRTITVQRRGQSYIVNIENFLLYGDQASNPWLQSDDVVFVPRRQPKIAFILGAISQPGIVDLESNNVSLTEVVARQGGLDEIRADARGIFVFRLVDRRVHVYQLDVQSPSGFVVGAQFLVMPDDVVYVTRSPIQRWNDTITRLLPLVGAAQAGVSLGPSI